MSGFDIKSLVDFRPPKYLCMVCNGILFSIETQQTLIGQEERVIFKCPICEQIYIEDDIYPRAFLNQYCRLEFDDLLKHSQRLAKVVHRWGTENEYQTTIE